MQNIEDVNSVIGLLSRGFFQNRTEWQLNVLSVKSSESVNTGVPLPYQFIYLQRLWWIKEVISRYWLGGVTILRELLQQGILWNMLEERKSNANSVEQLWRNCQWSWHFFINSWLPMVQRLIDWKQEWPHQLSPWRHETTIACSSLRQTKGLKAHGESRSLFPSPKAVIHLNVNASLKGTQPHWTRKKASKQMLICRTRGTNCSLVWTWVCSRARHRKETVWQEASMQPSVEAPRPETVHSLHMDEQFPPKWLLTNSRPNYRRDWRVCLACWIYLRSFFFFEKESSHIRTKALGQISSKIKRSFL